MVDKLHGVGSNNYEAQPDTINNRQNDTVNSKKEIVIPLTSDSTNNDGIGLMQRTMNDMQREDFNLEEYMEKLRQQYPTYEDKQKSQNGI